MYQLLLIISAITPISRYCLFLVAPIYRVNYLLLSTTPFSLVLLPSISLVIVLATTLNYFYQPTLLTIADIPISYSLEVIVSCTYIKSHVTYLFQLPYQLPT